MTVDVTAVDDPATGKPTISGTARVGQILTADVSAIADTADGLPQTSTFAYQWLSVSGSGEDITETEITDATARTYRLVTGDAGKKFKVTVSFTDLDGHPEALTSDAYPTSTPSLNFVDGNLRLVDGRESNEGRLEIFHDREWGTICDDYWDRSEADLSCRLLGYAGAAEDWGEYRTAYFGPGTGPIVLDNLACRGDESGLLQCPRHNELAIREHNCTHREDVSLRCSEAPWLVDIEHTGSPGPDGRYDEGEVVELTLVWSEPVAIETMEGHSLPKVWLHYEGDPLNSNTLSPSYVRGSGTARTVFAATLHSGLLPDHATWAWFHSLRVKPDSLSVPSGSTIRALDDGIDAKLEHGEYMWELATAEQQVAADPPTVDGTPTVSGAGDDGSWTESETVQVALSFSEAVEVDTSGGTPSIGIHLGGSSAVARSAPYVSGSGTVELTFGYTLVQGDGAHSLMAVAPNSLALGGGTIRSAESGVDALLAHNGTLAQARNSLSNWPIANFLNVPDSHDGETAFKVGLRFSGAPAGLDPKRDAASVLEVTGGSVTGARQKTTGKNTDWEVTVAPVGRDEVTVRIPARACGETHAVCIGGQPLSKSLEATVPGPQTFPVVSIAASTTPLAEGTAASFTLSRTGATDAALTVTVSVSESGTVVSGTAPTEVTFAENSATATLSVATADDEVAEDASTVTAAVSSGTGYTVDGSSGSAEVVVEDDDAAPVVTTASPIEVAENGTAVATLAATDEDTAAEDLSWSIPRGADGGADAAKFSLTESGVLTFKAAKDYEAPDDADPDGDYEVTVQVTDGVNPVDASLVVRLTDVDEGAPVLSSATVDGAALTLTFSEELDGDSVPPETSFPVTVAGSSRTVDSVALSGSAVTLTLSSAVTSGETVTVGYTVPTGEDAKPAKDTAGNAAVAFANFQVTNETVGLPVVSIAASATPVTEGTAATFTLSRTGATDAALTVTVSVSQAGSVLDGTPPTSVTFAASSASATLSVATADDTADEADARVSASIAAGEGYEVDGDKASAGVDVFDDEETVQSASGVVELWTTTMAWTDLGHGWYGGLDDAFEHPGWSEDGRTFRIWYISYDATARRFEMMHDGSGGLIAEPGELTLHVGAFSVGPGEAMTSFAHASPGDVSNVDNVWEAGEKVTVRLTRTTGDAAPAPPGISVADARVNESSGAPLSFRVTLAEPTQETVSVRYRTSDGTARAGEDYVAAHGAVRFTRGQTAKTVEVAVLEDRHDEASETLTLTLWGPYGATLSAATAIGTIVNTDPIPRAWIARFGRTVAEQALDAVEGRMRVARQAGAEVSLGGQRIGLGPPFGGSGSGAVGAGGRALEEDAAKDAAPGAADALAQVARDAGEKPAAGDLAEWLRGATADPEMLGFASEAGSADMGRSMSGREFLLRSSFSVTAQAAGEGFVSFWGRGAVTRFDGQDGALGLDGEVTSAMLGTDWSQGRWTTGLVVAHSLGEGGYRDGSDGAGSGTISATLTGLYPWLRHALSDRLEAWGVAGYGQGSLALKPGEAPAIRTDLDLWMAAAGLRGTVVDGGGEGLTLVGKTDAMIVNTSTDAVSGSGAGGGRLAAEEGEVTRLRLALEASRPVVLGASAMLTPSLEVGVRHDGGDAETGFGADLGAGLTLSDPERGISTELRGRGLLSHESKGFRERGLSGSLAWEPAGNGRGPRLSLTRTVGGMSSGGAEALFGRGTLEGLAANDNGGGSDLANGRFEARFGYGFAAFGDRFTWTPELGVGLSDAGRDYSLGWRLARRAWGANIGSLELFFEARRLESANDDTPPGHEVGFRLGARW